MNVRELAESGNQRYLEMLRHMAIYEDIARQVECRLEDFDFPVSIGADENELCIELSFEVDGAMQLEQWRYQFTTNSAEIKEFKVAQNKSSGASPSV